MGAHPPSAAQQPDVGAGDSTISRAHQHATNTRRPEACKATAHHAVDGGGRPLAVVVTPRQSHDGQILQLLLDDLRVPRRGRGRPKTRPEALLADKAYSSRAIRQVLRSRGIRAVTPERRDQQDLGEAVADRAGAPRSSTPENYKSRNVVERSLALLKQRQGLATRFDKLAIVYRSAAILAAVPVWARN